MSLITNSQILDNVHVNLYQTKSGNYWLPNQPKDVVLQTIINDRVYDQTVVDFVKRESLAGDTILDVGSNFGQMAVQYSKHVGSSGKVYAFEAQEWIQKVLQLNLDANGITNCSIVRGAVWDQPNCQLTFPKADFVRFDSYGSYGITPNATVGDIVPSILIDDLDITGRVSVIKIDVQGADLRAMIGARKTIQTHKPVIVFEYEDLFNTDFASSWQDYLNFIDSINYYIDISIGSNFVIRPR